MSCAILLVGTAAGVPTEFDGQYVKAYDPTVLTGTGGYDGGVLEVTGDLREALRFPDSESALKKWKQSFGTRSDGQPNRPLTAWNVEIRTISEEVAA